MPHAGEAHDFELWLLAGPQPTEVLDAGGEIWEICRETVRVVLVWEAATGIAPPEFGERIR